MTRHVVAGLRGIHIVGEPNVRDLLERMSVAGHAVDLDFPTTSMVVVTASDRDGETFQVTGNDELEVVTELARLLGLEDSKPGSSEAAS